MKRMTKSSEKDIKKKTKVEKSGDAVKKSVKKTNKSPVIMKKVIKTTVEDVPTQRVKKTVGKKLENQPIGGINEKLKNPIKKMAPRAPKSEVKSEKSEQTKVKVVKRRVAPEESSLPAKKKSKTSLEGKKNLKSRKQNDNKPGEDKHESDGGKKKIKNPGTSSVAEEIVGIGNLEMTEAHVKKCVEAVLHLANKSKEGKKSLLPEDDNVIFLQVNCIKIPKVPRRQLRVFLPHMMVGPTDEVALFVPDLERGRRKDYEKTVDHWETILREKNVTRIKEILPMNKVKTEFSQYEMKLKLGRMFDFFLVDGRIAGHMSHLLGKTFKRSARPPTPVKLQRDNLKSEIENALRKTSLEIHGAGNCHTMQVASVTMSEQEIKENIIAACEALAKDYPGGWKNIRSVLVKTTRGLGIPVYFSIQNKNKVPVATISGKRPKAFKTVEGELSTTLSKVTVKVAPGGRVTLKKIEEEVKA